jgi:Ser/Thr protein kinase RdoA (MazF antagonist)
MLQNERDAILKVVAAPISARACRGDTRNGTFVLRIHPTVPTGGPQALRAQARWLRAILRDTDVVVPEPIPDLQGNYLTAIPAPALGDSAHCSLMRWVAGKPRLLATGPGPDALRQVGRMMAKLHRHSRRFSPGVHATFPRYDYEGLFGRSSRYYPKDSLDSLDLETRRLFDLAMRRTRDVMRELGFTPDVFGLIHADLIQVNYIFHRGRVRAIDFGDCGYGYYLYDMAVTLLMLDAFDPDASQRAAFLQGYRQIQPLPAKHEQLLDIFVAGRAAALARWFMGDEHLRDEAWVDWAAGRVRHWLGC